MVAEFLVGGSVVCELGSITQISGAFMVVADLIEEFADKASMEGLGVEKADGERKADRLEKRRLLEEEEVDMAGSSIELGDMIDITPGDESVVVMAGDTMCSAA